MTEWPICKTKVEWSTITNESPPPRAIRTVIVYLIDCLHDKFADFAIKCRDIAVIVIAGPFAIETETMSIIAVIERGLLTSQYDDTG